MAIVPTAVHHCARCGGDHAAVRFKALTHEIMDGDRVLASHWAWCPENGEPILMRLVDPAATPFSMPSGELRPDA